MSALLDAWKGTVRRRKDACAVMQAADGRAATFGELDTGATAWLATHAPDPSALAGRAVAFAMPNGVAWLEIFIALLRSGAVAVPVDSGEPAAAQRRIAESLRAGFWWDGTKLVTLPKPKRWSDPDVCLIKLTSGSTGAPKPLAFTAGQMLADGRQVTATMGIGARDLNYALIPLGHSYGLGNLTIPLLAQGVPVVCGSAPLPHAIAADFARWQPTVFPGVPAIWRVLASSDVKLDSLRVGISAGAPLSPEVAQEFAARFGRKLHGFYGSSETGGIAYDRRGDATLRGGVGQAMRDVKLVVRRGQRLEVASAAVMTSGHSRRRGKFGAWLMADRVEVDARGQLTLLGRRGATVKVAGRRVNLGEVTARLRRLAGVGEVWVGVGAGNEPVLGAALATTRPVPELRAELLADTAAWKIPKKLVTMSALPVTERGKVDTAGLRRAIFGG